MTIRPWKPGPVYHPSVLLPGADAVPGAEGVRRLCIEGWQKKKTFPALEWLAAMCSHIPNKGEHMVRYYGYYSNVSRGRRRRRERMTPCPPSSKHRAIERSSGRTGRGSFRRFMRSIPWYAPNDRGHADHQFHRGRSCHPRHPRTPGPLARPVQAAAQNS
jgi:hypothetical protein